MSNPRGWNCDECRTNNLEIKRRCAWLPSATLPAPRPVWVRNGVYTEACPKSLVQPQSLAWIEEFVAWRRIGGIRLDEMSARQVDAFLILDAELTAEHDDAKRSA